MKKIFCFFISLLIIFNSITVLGADNKYAYSFGTNYDGGWFDDDIDTSQAAKNAATDFGIAGYKSYYNIKPTVQYMRGNNPNTNAPRMESDVLFFDGHGNYQCIAFNYKQKGGDYKTGIYYGKNFDSPSSGYKYAGIKSYNFSKVKLVTFAGCNTAEGTDNITKRAVDEGAKTAVGWRKSVGTKSLTQWLARYTNELALGKSVKEAVDYANSFTYSDNNVKTVVIKGNENLRIKISKANSKSYLHDDNVGEEYPIDRNKILNDRKFKEININTDLPFNSEKPDYVGITTFIKDKINPKFNITEYIIYLTKRNRKSSVIDIVYKIGDFETNSSYTVLVENGKVKKIIDNTITIKNDVQTNVNKKVKYSINNYTSQKITEKSIGEEYRIENQESKYYYDINNNKRYHIILLTLRHLPTNTFVKEEYFYEIK
ncbi:hypothetical protein SAMN02745135_02584 [Caloranaerobacter azorensis DSM 13643]|uniref:CHAT domain-containing protein n=1 Tax=Caloranaerobacter azorensis DSM 13643 TaxID=1121264 RepID=A0A1M5WPH9_9FIRM|nr:hypothetical protein [Caloranaerobacter azorensis]SHH89460.1 hypothetical protein SAMN02745135_02584 [Caloranaerobacter azorensis DSM 13643]